MFQKTFKLFKILEMESGWWICKNGLLKETLSWDTNLVWHQVDWKLIIVRVKTLTEMINDMPYDILKISKSKCWSHLLCASLSPSSTLENSNVFCYRKFRDRSHSENAIPGVKHRDLIAAAAATCSPCSLVTYWTSDLEFHISERAAVTVFLNVILTKCDKKKQVWWAMKNWILQ